MSNLRWVKTWKRSWDVYWKDTLIGHLRREYRIGRGTCAYSLASPGYANGTGRQGNWTRLVDAVHHLAVMQSGLIVSL